MADDEKTAEQLVQILKADRSSISNEAEKKHPGVKEEQIKLDFEKSSRERAAVFRQIFLKYEKGVFEEEIELSCADLDDDQWHKYATKNEDVKLCPISHDLLYSETNKTKARKRKVYKSNDPLCF